MRMLVRSRTRFTGSGARHGLQVHVVANAFIRVPKDPLISLTVVEAGPDVADDWIAERAGPRDVVVTTDIPLAAARAEGGCGGAQPKGVPFTEDSIGAALAQRAIMEHLRSVGRRRRRGRGHLRKKIARVSFRRSMQPSFAP